MPPVVGVLVRASVGQRPSKKKTTFSTAQFHSPGQSDWFTSFGSKANICEGIWTSRGLSVSSESADQRQQQGAWELHSDWDMR